MNKEKILTYLTAIEEKKPLIHCLTNEITVNDVANALLAVGASPTMAHHIEEVEEITLKSDGLLINLGATEYLDSIRRSGSVRSVRKVFDPVGAAGSSFRRRQALDLIETIHPDLIKGNWSEMLALDKEEETARAIDNEFSPAKDRQFIQLPVGNLRKYAHEHSTIAIATGPTDLITDGDRAYLLDNGSPLMSRFTGSGCIAGGLLSAFLAVDKSLDAALAAMVFSNLCGEIAEELMKRRGGGYGSYRMYYFDAFYYFKTWPDMPVQLREI